MFIESSNELQTEDKSTELLTESHTELLTELLTEPYTELHTRLLTELCIELFASFLTDFPNVILGDITLFPILLN
jgi:hypothetical protein